MDGYPLVSEEGYDSGRSSSTSNMDSEDIRLLQGCTFIEDALNFRLTYHKVDSRSLKMYRMYHSRPVQWSINLVLAIILLLIFFEAPSSLSSTADIRKADSERVIVPPYILLPIEGTCLLLLSFDCFVKIYSYGIRQVRSYPWHLAYAVCLMISITGWIVAIAVPCCNTWPDCGNLCKWRCLCRPLFLMQHSSIIKKALKCTVKALPSILSVLLLIFLHILLFTMLGLALFPSESGPVQISPGDAEGDIYFSTATEALVNMIILLTTSNNPNIMLKAYNNNRMYSLFFIVYVTIGIYCFLYILLAVVFQQFREYFKASLRNQVLRRRAGLVAAFQILSDADDDSATVRTVPARRLAMVIANLLVSDEVKERIYNKFRSELNNCNLMVQNQANEVNQMDEFNYSLSWHQFFKKIFAFEVSSSKKDFMNTMRAGVREPSNAHSAVGYEPIDSLSLDEMEEEQEVLLNQRCPKVLNFLIRSVRLVFSHLYFIHFGSVLNVVNVIFIIVQTSNDERKTAMEAPTYVFICYYAFEQIGILWAVGVGKFFSSWLHRVDAIFTMLALLSTLIYLTLDAVVAKEHLDVRYAAVAVTHILIGIRLVRVILSLKMPHLIVRTMADLLSNLIPFLGLLMAQFYLFAVLGMLLFADTISYDSNMEGCWHWDENDTYSEACRPPNSTKCIYGRDYHSNEFWAVNFNDFASSIVVLWDLMVVNNWQVVMEAYTKATNTWAQLYFITWYVLTVLICLDLFIAVIVENFNTRWNIYSTEKHRIETRRKRLADAQAGRMQSARQSRVEERTNARQLGRARAATQSRPMDLAYILGVEAPNMDLVREHLLSNPYYSAYYAEHPDNFLAVYDTESEDENELNRPPVI